MDIILPESVFNSTSSGKKEGVPSLGLPFGVGEAGLPAAAADELVHVHERVEVGELGRQPRIARLEPETAALLVSSFHRGGGDRSINV